MKSGVVKNISDVKLSDCYEKSTGLAMFSGTQALVRLMIEQARLDREAGLKTGGLVSGYPGSPLGGLDFELIRIKHILDEEGIVFQPGLNEELAATALWGSQQIELYDHPSYDGVFGLWYGKGPGLDRSMDALRHANHGGVAPKGGLVIAVGDDPAGKSSTIAYQSDQSFQSLGMPYFYPRRVEDIIPMGLQAFALSRYAGVCVGLKIVTDTADANVVQDTAALRPNLITPDDAGQVHIGRHEHSLVREQTLFQVRLPAVKKWQQSNPVNHPIGKSPQQKRLGIVAVGKAAIETIEALHALGFDQPHRHGIGVFSVGLPYPLEEGAVLDFAQGYDEILVVEEKRALVEEQLAHILINVENSPHLLGKQDKNGNDLIPQYGELSPGVLTSAIGSCISDLGLGTMPGDQAPDLGNLPPVAPRTPYFCAGCPHNSSTKLPDGAVVGMGIGCHTMSAFVTPEAITNFCQMGGEGASWIGRAPFSELDHTFQNMGDGTYAHSGYLAVRAAIAAKVNMTFKILYNDAVAMTGGQTATGGSTPDGVARQLVAEGVKAVAVVGDDPKGTEAMGDWPKIVQFHHRRDIIQVQEDLSAVKGISAIVYVQTCAAELRRRRKRGKIPDRPEHLFINEAVCEGCGDCAAKSNCVAVKPVTKPDGIKRQIDQSICNKDYSCNEGFCPSFVSVRPSSPAKSKTDDVARPDLPAATLPKPPAAKTGISNIFLAGIGGTGVTTISAVLVMAGRLDGVYAQAINLTGLSQKNGAVTSEVRMSPDTPLDLRTVHLPARSANVLIGCDAVVSTSDAVLKTLDPEQSSAVINARLDPVGVFGVGAGHVVDDSLLMSRLNAVLNADKVAHYDISSIAERLMGSTVTANVMLIGAALQMGLIPVRPAALEGALRLNGVSVDDNLKAMQWGRWLVADADRVLKASGVTATVGGPKLDDMPASDAVSHFAENLIGYQNEVYAGRYRDYMADVLAALSDHHLKDDMLARKAARAVYRLMSVKDEYEVGRLMTSDAFKEAIHQQFGTVKAIHYNVAPPFLSWVKNRNGIPKKIRLGGWLGIVFSILSKMKVLRGTPFDLFGLMAERRRERRFRDEKMALILQIARQDKGFSPDHFDALLEAILSVRGYGYVKEASMNSAETVIADLVAGKTNNQIAAE
jgi:indolepyruvate ferredoxin oxidoreductase